MKKQMTKLTLNRETVRRLDQTTLSNVLGGVINVKSLLTECDNTGVGSTSPSC